MKRIPRVLLASLALTHGLAYASYQIKEGDTLTQIAESKYGNWIKWQDLWQVNKEHIANPDLIYPGQRLQLLTDEQLALFAQNNQTEEMGRVVYNANANDAGAGERMVPIRRRAHHSQEWRLLPTQSWEIFVYNLDPSIDADGFDRRSRVAARVADKATADVTIASDRIPVLGEITNARTEYERVFLGEQVFVRADEQLQVGTVYSITTGPQKLVSKRDGRVGFAYDLTGKVRIIGVRDGLFIGTVVALYHPIQRHQLLIPEVVDYQFVEPTAASTPINSILLTPQASREDFLGEQKIVFLDAGSNEGVKPGNIFRHYLHTDPGTNEAISSKDFLIESEVQVLTVLDKFSVGVILKSHSIAHFGDELVAITDLKDFEHNQGLQTTLQDKNKPTTVDDLDKLDSTDGLGEKESHDLRQLEKWAKPNPEIPPVSDTVDNDEIKRVETREHPRVPIEIGKEPAPNDGTDKPQTAPELNPAPNTAEPPSILDASPVAQPPVIETPTPAPQATPTAQPNPQASPPPLEDSLGPSIQSTTTPSAEPPPIKDTNPLPTADPFATPNP